VKPVECQFESEVLAAVLQSRWPDRVDAQLRAHVAACAICSDVTAIAGAVDEAREEIRAQAVIPNSGRVWWLAQMRARRDAARDAGRPITAVQVIALACAMGVLGACFGATSEWFQSTLGRVVSGATGFQLKTLIPSATALVAEHGALVLAMAAVVLLVPAAVYVAMLRD
jgi:hypothetical protein